MELPIHIRISRYLNGQHTHYRAFKRQVGSLLRRTLDIAGASLGLVFLSPVFAFIAAIIKLDSPGPAFYRGIRVGKNGKTFRMLKFRTMYENPESYQGPKITGEGDPRITPVGQWLRDTKLNELPQLWNVLVGDMSLIGPRPEDPAYIDHWPEESRGALLSIRPGITSPASIVYRDEESMMQSVGVEDQYINEILPSKLNLDLLYVERRSLISDLDVILWTLVTLLPRVSKRKIPDHMLYWGPVSRFATRHFSWFAVDVIVTFFVVAVLGILWRTSAPLHVGLEYAILYALIMVICFSSLNYALGLSRMWWNKANAGYVLFLFVSAFVATAAILFMNQWLPVSLPTTLIVVAGVVAWIGFVIVRYRLRLVTGAARHLLNARPGATLLGERVLIVGAGVVGRFATSMLNDEDLLPAYAIIGMVDDDPRKNGVQIGDYRVLGTTQDIESLVKRHDVSIVVFAITDLSESERERILTMCQTTEARVVFLPDVVHTIQNRFSSIVDEDPIVPDLTDRFDEELNEIQQVLEQGKIREAQERILALRSELAQSQADESDHAA